MSQLQCYNAFLKKGTNNIGMQAKWIAEEEWICQIRKQEESLDDCTVSHMNCSSLAQCQFQNNHNRLESPANKKIEQEEDCCYCESYLHYNFIHVFYNVLPSAMSSITAILCDTKS
jgi:hypothetical protein